MITNITIEKWVSQSEGPDSRDAEYSLRMLQPWCWYRVVDKRAVNLHIKKSITYHPPSGTNDRSGKRYLYSKTYYHQLKPDLKGNRIFYPYPHLVKLATHLHVAQAEKKTKEKGLDYMGRTIEWMEQALFNQLGMKSNDATQEHLRLHLFRVVLNQLESNNS